MRPEHEKKIKNTIFVQLFMLNSNLFTDLIWTEWFRRHFNCNEPHNQNILTKVNNKRYKQNKIG